MWSNWPFLLNRLPSYQLFDPLFDTDAQLLTLMLMGAKQQKTDYPFLPFKL